MSGTSAASRAERRLLDSSPCRRRSRRHGLPCRRARVPDRSVVWRAAGEGRRRPSPSRRRRRSRRPRHGAGRLVGRRRGRKREHRRVHRAELPAACCRVACRACHRACGTAPTVSSATSSAGRSTSGSRMARRWVCEARSRRPRSRRRCRAPASFARSRTRSAHGAASFARSRTRSAHGAASFAHGDSLGSRADGTMIGTGPVVGDRSTYSTGSPSGDSSAVTSTATRRARSNACSQRSRPCTSCSIWARARSRRRAARQHALAVRRAPPRPSPDPAASPSRARRRRRRRCRSGRGRPRARRARGRASGLVARLTQQLRRPVLGPAADAALPSRAVCRMRAASSPSGRVAVSSSSGPPPADAAQRVGLRGAQLRSRNRSRSWRRASSAATMRRKSRTSCWSKPRRRGAERRVGHAGRATTDQDGRTRWPRRKA